MYLLQKNMVLLGFPQRIIVALCIFLMHLVVIGLTFDSRIHSDGTDSPVQNVRIGRNTEFGSFRISVRASGGASVSQTDNADASSRVAYADSHNQPVENSSNTGEQKTKPAMSDRLQKSEPAVAEPSSGEKKPVVSQVQPHVQKKQEKKVTVKNQKEQTGGSSYQSEEKSSDSAKRGRENMQNAGGTAAADVKSSSGGASGAGSEHSGAGAEGSSPAGGSDHARAKIVYRPKFVYPQQARRFGYEGTVVLDLLVDPEGTVENIKIHSTSKYPILDEYAVKYAGRIRFSPASSDGRPLYVTVRIPVTFRLK